MLHTISGKTGKSHCTGEFGDHVNYDSKTGVGTSNYPNAFNILQFNLTVS